ncbi:MAG TPA: UDP-N-acetylmuramoyl-L-alanyl-D-glutamate--2,6-diaminopimelate ligase [Candidatus Peribacteraceae bacterium]|nr:UDP-N-acetylmuramoyl-L-alanyl-D-glutamate--2,6-diaminopimelate ligase [Candidatus Peribacteraceae bacterium]
MSLKALKRLIPEQHPLRLLWHKSKALAAATRYGFPARKLTVIGITGTDGKTTTVGMTAHILQQNGVKVGALSTAFFQINEEITWNATQKTSPSPFLIQKFLKRLVNEGCTHAVLEYSSHGLVQGRTTFTYPQIAGITNISEEHLDYHGTMKEYIHAKSLLFRMLNGRGTKVLHASDATTESFIRIRTDSTILYDRKRPVEKSDTQLWLSDIRNDAHPSATVHSQRNASPGTAPLSLNVTGEFNLENALCAVGCSMAAGIDLQRATEALKTFMGIPGRMEMIDEGQDFSVYVDFTVTPQSYEKTLSTLKSMLKPGKKLLVLTGSCGDRMKEKRPIVGKIVSEYADVTVVTNEDPYTENPEKIIDDVWAGIDQKKTDAHRIFDRREAIAFLLKQAKTGDIVIFCGKGSDTTMWTKTGQIPWNEREIVRDLLKTQKSRPS